MDRNKKYQCPACRRISDTGYESGDNQEHCPNCLSGVHKVSESGNECGGILEPITIWVKPDNTWDILQMCNRCGEIVASPASENDNPSKLLELASRPLRYGMKMEQLPEEVRKTWLPLLFRDRNKETQRKKEN